MKKIIAFIVLILLFLLKTEAQQTPPFSPFKGFHVGITAQVEAIGKPLFLALDNINPAPKGLWTCGWEAGMEFSYHFAKYFGISVGINYGTTVSYNCVIYQFKVIGQGDIIIPESFVPLYCLVDHEIMFPVKFEFHFPLRKNLFFAAETGIKIKGVGFLPKLSGGDDVFFSGGLSISFEYQDIFYKLKYFDYFGTRDVTKIRCEFLLGMGLYYKLRYGDLLRFTAGVNLSFKNIVEGTYSYHLSGSFGTFAVKNDFLYFQFAYIHTLNYQKAKKYLKKQGNLEGLQQGM